MNSIKHQVHEVAGFPH